MADSNVLASSYVENTLRWAKANAMAEKTQEVNFELELDARRRAREDSNFQKFIILHGIIQQREDLANKLSDFNVTTPEMFQAAGLSLSEDMKATLGKMKHPETAASVRDTLMKAMLAKKDYEFRQRVQAKAEGRNTFDAWTAVLNNYSKVSGPALDALMGAGNDPASVDEAIAQNTGSAGDVAPLVALYNIMGYGKRPEYKYTPPPWGTLRMYPWLQDEPTGGDVAIREANIKALLNYQAENKVLLADSDNKQITELLKPQYVDERGKQLSVPSSAVMSFRRRIETLDRNLAPRLAILQQSTRVGKLTEALQADPTLVKEHRTGLFRAAGGREYTIEGDETKTKFTVDEYKRAKALAGGKAPAAPGVQGGSSLSWAKYQAMCKKYGKAEVDKGIRERGGEPPTNPGPMQ